MAFTNRLSILVACYNEERTIITLLEKVIAVQLIGVIHKEIIVIDDASTDSSYTLVEHFIERNPQTNILLFTLAANSGKGASIQKGLQEATGDIIVIQDADLEYDPSDYNKLLKPICDGHADVVYGSRFRGSEPHRVLFYFHTIGNKFLTGFSNIFTQLNLTDMETGYKMFRTEKLKQIRLTEKRFGIEPEITAKISRIKNIRIYEVGISYYGRNFEEGKKINWKDGVWCMFCILKYNLFSRK